jgi:hypothetical protein
VLHITSTLPLYAVLAQLAAVAVACMHSLLAGGNTSAMLLLYFGCIINPLGASLHMPAL